MPSETEKSMLKQKLMMGAAAFLTTVSVVGAGHAAIFLSGYNVSSAVAENAIPSNVPATPADYTASAPASTTFSVDSSPVDTVGMWITSGGGTLLTGDGTHSMDNTLWNITGTVTVTNGETFTFKHDDGITLDIAGLLVVSAPGPTSATTTTGTYTGASGNKPFQLVYGECCGGPAVLNVNLPFVSPGVPEPSTWAMMGLGFAGLGFVGFRRARKTAVSIA
jgi:PEP-CTERM motif